MNHLPELMNTQQVAVLFGVKPETIRNWISEGKLPGVRLGSQWRIKKDDVLKYINERYGS